MADYIAAKTKRGVRATGVGQDEEEERAHLKTIQDRKAATQLEMAFEELMKDIGEKVADGTSSDDETTNNGRTCSPGDGSGPRGDDGDDGEGRVR